MRKREKRITVAELSKVHEVDVRTIRRWINEERLPGYIRHEYISGTILVYVEESNTKLKPPICRLKQNKK